MRTKDELADELIRISTESQGAIRDLKFATGHLQELLLHFVDIHIDLLKLSSKILEKNKELEDKK